MRLRDQRIADSKFNLALHEMDDEDRHRLLQRCFTEAIATVRARRHTGRPDDTPAQGSPPEIADSGESNVIPLEPHRARRRQKRGSPAGAEPAKTPTKDAADLRVISAIRELHSAVIASAFNGNWKRMFEVAHRTGQ